MAREAHSLRLQALGCCEPHGLDDACRTLYCGSSTRIPDASLGQGGNVVVGLLDNIRTPEGTEVLFDNLFTSTPPASFRS